MTSHIRYPRIGQFRSVVKEVKIHNDGGVLPILKFKGTVKNHGSNSSIVFNDNSEIHYQSRNRILSLDNDNMGFVKFMTNVGEENLNKLLCDVLHHDFKNVKFPITVFGEFCGGNIQKNVALSQLDKMFIIFGIRYGDGEDHSWGEMNKLSLIESPEHNIHNIMKFPTFEMEIDFNHPEMAQNELIELTTKVGDECPVGKYFGISGTGEGIVWECIEDDYRSSKFKFKTKDARHSPTRIKKLVEVDIEKVNSIIEFVESTVTENRLNQGIEYLNEMNIELSKSSTPHFLRWMVNDINSEECDRRDASGLSHKDVNRDISTKARTWYFNYLEGEF